MVEMIQTFIFLYVICFSKSINVGFKENINNRKECPLYWCGADTYIKIRETAIMCSNTKYSVILNLSNNMYTHPN